MIILQADDSLEDYYFWAVGGLAGPSRYLHPRYNLAFTADDVVAASFTAIAICAVYCAATCPVSFAAPFDDLTFEANDAQDTFGLAFAFTAVVQRIVWRTARELECDDLILGSPAIGMSLCYSTLPELAGPALAEAALAIQTFTHQLSSALTFQNPKLALQAF